MSPENHGRDLNGPLPTSANKELKLYSLDRAQVRQSKSEIEVADFDRLFSRLERIEMAVPAMRELLVAIKET